MSSEKCVKKTKVRDPILKWLAITNYNFSIINVINTDIVLNINTLTTSKKVLFSDFFISINVSILF